MNVSRALFGITSFVLIAGAPTLMACASPQEAEDNLEGALAEGGGQWVVDMAKVLRRPENGGFGSAPHNFFGIGPEDYCRHIEAWETCGAKPTVWDQTFRFGPQSRGNAVEFRKPYSNDKMNAVVKLADGRIVGPKGRGVNIIPLLKDTDPVAQTHLRKWLKNGDVLTFFYSHSPTTHPLMDRRMNHTAMHYDYKSPHTGREHVHHVDNANDRAPAYNYAPERQMPFHVFRYQPKGMDSKRAEAYATAARNWAFLSDDLSPEGGTYSLQTQTLRDLQATAVAPLLKGQPLAPIDSSGLAWTNLNLGINHPLKPGMLSRDYLRVGTGEAFRQDDCRDPASEKCVLTPARYGEVEATSLEARAKLLFEPYTTSDFATVWLDSTYGEQPVEMRAEIARRRPILDGLRSSLLAGATWSGSDGKDAPRQGIPSGAAVLENLTTWAAAYTATIEHEKKGGAGSAAGSEVVRAFVANNKLETRDGQLVALSDLIATHTTSRPSDADPAKWISIDVATMSPRQILRALELSYVATRFVPPRIWADQADDASFFPSGSDPRAESKGDLVYVGTVINCELLTASDGSGGDACALDDGEKSTDSR